MSCCLSLLIVSMDATIVNVAIPNIREDLHATPSQLQWVIDIYTLVLASLLLLSGATADRFGRRRTFQVGLTVFALGSLLCSLSPTIEILILARMLQAIGGSMLNPVAMSIITQVFTGRVERARAIGVWGGVVGISMALGPIVGGALIELVNWTAVFWINLPICAVAIVLTAIFVPESRSVTMRDVDPVGQGLGMTFLFGVVYVLIEGPVRGWNDARIVVVAVVALLAFVWFLRYESRRHDPFIDLRFFRSIPFASATMIAVCAFAAWGAFLFVMALYLQDERGFSAIAHRTDLYARCHWRTDLFATVGADGRSLRQPAIPADRRYLDYRGDGDADPIDRDHSGVAGAGDLRRLRHRVRDGERARHQRGGQWHADRSSRCRLGGGLDQSPGGRECRCRTVWFSGGVGAGDLGCGLRGRGQTAVGHMCGTRRGDHRPGPLLDIGASAAFR